MLVAGQGEQDAPANDEAIDEPDPPNSVWPRAVRAGLGIWAATRVGYLLLAWLITDLRTPIYGRVEPGVAWPFAVYSRYDSGHYIRIAQFGFFSRGPADPNAAFFPGYPLLGRYVCDIVGLGRVTSLERLAVFALLAWLGAAVASVLLWRWVEEIAGRRAAAVSVLALLLGPYSLFFMASYSEGLFLALALGAWLCGRRGSWLWAGLLAAAATLVRVNGLFLLGGLLVMYVLDARRTGRPPLRRDALTLPLPVVVVAAFFAWLRSRTGHWDAWFRSEKIGWQRTSDWPWHTLINSIRRYQTTAPNAPLHFQAVLELLFAALYVIVLAALARRRLWPELTYVGLGVLSLFSSSFYQSVPRSMIVAFPIFLLVGQWSVGRRRWTVAVLAVASGALLVTNVTLFVRGYLAG